MPIQIKQSSRTRYVRDLGEFSIVSGAIRFTDPCYANDVWCKGSMLAANGKYQAQIGFFRDPYDERSMLEKINQFKYLLHYHAKFGETYKDHLFSFEKLVSKARDQANWDGKLQSVDRLFQLIKEEPDIEKQRIYKELADDAVDAAPENDAIQPISDVQVAPKTKGEAVPLVDVLNENEATPKKVTEKVQQDEELIVEPDVKVPLENSTIDTIAQNNTEPSLDSADMKSKPLATEQVQIEGENTKKPTEKKRTIRKTAVKNEESLSSKEDTSQPND